MQEPTGTTLMDFELNQSSMLCANGVNPVRTVGDLLIEYRIEQGGAGATIKAREWTGSAWGTAQDLTAARQAAGTINGSPIAAADSDGLVTSGSLSPRTFGEAQLDLEGAINITKMRKHAADGSGDHPHPVVTFTVTGGGLPAGGVTAVTNAQGAACVDGLVLSSFVGNYTVTETVPAGYRADSTNPQTVAVTAEATCTSGTAATVSFHNTPLTDASVSVNSHIDGGTASTIECKRLQWRDRRLRLNGRQRRRVGHRSQPATGDVHLHHRR